MNLPHNDIIEKQFVGQSLLDGRIASRELSTDEFYNPNYRAAWSAICELDENNKHIEPIAVHSIAKEIGMSLSFHELVGTTTGLVMNGNKPELAEQLKELALRRLLIKEFANAASDLEKGSLRLVLESVDTRLRDIRGSLQSVGFESLASIMDNEVKPAIADLQHGRTKKLSSGFPALDRVIGGGFVPSDVVLIVADTGNGKSSFALQLADQVAKDGVGVAFTSGEMRNRENGLRLLSQNAKTTNLNSVVRISETDADVLTQWANEIKHRPIYFDHSSSDLKSVRRNLKLLTAKHDVKVLIIDYIQLYKLTPNDRLGRVERLTELSQEVKRLANEFNICVIEVAQFNREGMKSKRPTMHDLEGSGQFEKDTSLIFIIDREDNDDINIRIEKGRNAGKTLVQGRFIGKELRFEL